MSSHGLMAHFFLVSHNIPLSDGAQFINPSPTGGHLGCLQVLAVITKATINTHVQVFV